MVLNFGRLYFIWLLCANGGGAAAATSSRHELPSDHDAVDNRFGESSQQPRGRSDASVLTDKDPSYEELYQKALSLRGSSQLPLSNLRGHLQLMTDRGLADTNSAIQPRIVGGEEANAGDFPYFGEFICSMRRVPEGPFLTPSFAFR